MANNGNFKSVLISFATMTGLLALCTLAGAESAVPMQPPVQLLEAVDSLDEEATAVRLVADAVSLQALALRIEAMSGIDVVIAPGLSQAVVNVRIASPNWETALQKLFSNYSTAVAWDQQGQVRCFYVLASTVRNTSLRAATRKPAPEAKLPHSMLPMPEDIATHSGSASQTLPDYEMPNEATEVLDLMNVAQGSGTTTIESLTLPQHRPEIRELLQRMRTVGKPMEKIITERDLATDTSEQASTAAQTP